MGTKSRGRGELCSVHGCIMVWPDTQGHYKMQEHQGASDHKILREAHYVEIL